MADLTILVDSIELTANWTDANPQTKAAVQSALPLTVNASRWGDELYGQIAVDIPPENTTEVVPVGAVAYWPTGNALCIFWGPTPASVDSQPRAASPVSVIAELESIDPLKEVTGDSTIRVFKA